VQGQQDNEKCHKWTHPHQPKGLHKPEPGLTRVSRRRSSKVLRDNINERPRLGSFIRKAYSKNKYSTTCSPSLCRSIWGVQLGPPSTPSSSRNSPTWTLGTHSQEKIAPIAILFHVLPSVPPNDYNHSSWHHVTYQSLLHLFSDLVTKGLRAMVGDQPSS